MTVYILLYEEDYNHPYNEPEWRIQGVYKNREDAQAVIDSKPEGRRRKFKIEGWNVQ